METTWRPPGQPAPRGPSSGMLVPRSLACPRPRHPGGGPGAPLNGSTILLPAPASDLGLAAGDGAFTCKVVSYDGFTAGPGDSIAPHPRWASSDVVAVFGTWPADTAWKPGVNL